MLVIIIWIIRRNPLGGHLERCSRISPLVLISLLIFFTNGNQTPKTVAVSFRHGPSTPAGTRTRALLWAGGLGGGVFRCGLSFLPPGLCVWPHGEGQVPMTPCLGIGPGARPALSPAVLCCAGGAVGGGSGLAGWAAGLPGAVVSTEPAVL